MKRPFWAPSNILCVVSFVIDPGEDRIQQMVIAQMIYLGYELRFDLKGWQQSIIQTTKGLDSNYNNEVIARGARVYIGGAVGR